MRFLLRANLLALVSLMAPPAHAWEFSCRTSNCVIPYDASGVANGLEVCYSDTKKSEKMKEVTWKNGVRQGPARCFENGKLRTEVTFDQNVIDGLRFDKNYDSRGDMVTRYDHGRQLGFRFHVSSDGNISEVWKCFKDEQLDEAANAECLKANYGPFQKKMQAVFDQRFRDEQERLKKLNGPQEEKYASGQLKAKYTMKDGHHVGESRSYHANGKLAREESYDAKGNLDGASNTFDEEGRKKFESMYAGGSLTKQIEYLQNGKPGVARTYTNGPGRARSVCTMYFYDSGARRSSDCRSHEGWYGGEGPTQSWYEDGQLSEEGQYEKGRPAGRWRHFFPDGKLELEYVYDKGNIQKSLRIHENGDREETEYFPDGSVKSQKRTTKAMST